MLKQCAGYIKNIIGNPKIAIILGSGLSELENLLENKVRIQYKDIPHFLTTTAEGHKGELIYGTINGREILIMSGRFHYYEGYEFSQIAFVIRVLKEVGIDKIIITSATGGVDKTLNAGDLLLINDHIKFFDDSPIRGKYDPKNGDMFPDMTFAYDREYISIAKKCASELNIDLKEGVYAFMPGPSYETPAEVRALSTLGASVVGMSTVPEVITAVQCRMRVLAITCVANVAAGVLNRPLSHKEVQQVVSDKSQQFLELLNNIIRNI